MGARRHKEISLEEWEVRRILSGRDDLKDVGVARIRAKLDRAIQGDVEATQALNRKIQGRKDLN